MVQREPLEVRRRHLLDTAFALAEEHGLAAVTARRVAAEAGVSLGVVHYCFSSTRELSARMAERMIEELAEAAMPTVREGRGPAGVRAMLGEAVAALWGHIERTRLRQLLTYEVTTLSVRDPAYADAARRQYAVSDAAATALLDALAASAGITWTTDVADLARLIVLAIDGATLRWLVDHDAQRALATLSRVADLIAASQTPRPHGPP